MSRGCTNDTTLAGVEEVTVDAGISDFDDVTLTDASGNTVDLDGVEVITGSAGDDILTVTDDTSVTLRWRRDGADTLGHR